RVGNRSTVDNTRRPGFVSWLLPGRVVSTITKGTRWRKVVQDWFTRLGYDTEAKAWMKPGDDITVTRGMLTLSVECKDNRTLSLPQWVTHAEEHCPAGHIPVVIDPRLGHASADGAYVIMSGAAFSELLESL